MYPTAFLLLALFATTFAIAPTNTQDAIALLAPVPKMTCGTCRTSTSLTLDWKHDIAAKVPATFYTIYWRLKKLVGEPDEWRSKPVTEWDDVTVQVTIGCCMGCETDVQSVCFADNLLSSKVYEIVAEAVYMEPNSDYNHTRISNALEIPTGQDGTFMPKAQPNPMSTDSSTFQKSKKS